MIKVLTVIGNACTDLLASVDDRFLVENHIRKYFCTHLASAEDLAILKSKMGHFQPIMGGAGANVAHVMSALGHTSHFISKIAADPEGVAFKTHMELNGVACHFPPPAPAVFGSPQVPTLITPDGERSFVSFDGVARSFCFADYDMNLLQKTDYLYLDGYCFSSPHTADGFIKAAEIVRARNGHVIFNVGDISIYESNQDKVQSLLKICDGLICNKAEAEVFFGQCQTTQDYAEKMMSQFLFGAITDGQNGSIVFNHDQSVHIPAIPISPSDLVDTNGAGDHFAAGFIYGLINQYALKDCGELGALCAADCLTHIGARPMGGHGSLKHLAERFKK